ncbi:hypothetical protein [Rhodococcus sp. KRD162]|uniref:hypothetical protein n=1 Tax=Rhodococcus sp. KRD162 TaxID=2729725 RepID=UPI0019D1F4F1|nr:hypothetical protein [Rhodococcus sp. KRD162]
MRTPGVAAMVSAAAALSGAGFAARVQRSNHREEYDERQEDRVRAAVVDLLNSRWTWPQIASRLADTVNASDYRTAEGRSAFKLAYAPILSEFNAARLEVSRGTERVRLVTQSAKILTALHRIDQLNRAAWKLAVNEGIHQLDEDLVPGDPFDYYSEQLVSALDYLSSETRRLTARHGLDDPLQPEDDASRKTIRKFKKIAKREGSAYATNAEAELPWWRYYPRKARQYLGQ